MKYLAVGVAWMLAVLAFVTFLGGCALVNKVKSQPTTVAQVLTVLQDSEWGVSAAHDQEWISDDEYILFTKVITQTEAVVNTVPLNAVNVARATLQQVELDLSPDSRLRPYLDAAIVLLMGVA